LVFSGTSFAGVKPNYHNAFNNHGTHYSAQRAHQVKPKTQHVKVVKARPAKVVVVEKRKPANDAALIIAASVIGFGVLAAAIAN
jgi:hypothetical protein